MTDGRHYWNSRRLSRRTLLRGSAIALGGLTGAALIGCGGSGDAESPAETVPPGATATSDTHGTSQAPRGGSLRVYLGTEPNSLDPQITGGGGTEHQYLYPLYDNLVTYDATGNLDASSSLAESWEVSDANEIVFHLRQGVKFHDGTDFDAEAVRYNLERFLDPNLNIVGRATHRNIASIDVTDDYTVAVQLSQPDAGFLPGLGDRGGFMMSPTAVETSGDDYSRNPVGTGPFRLERWVAQSQLTYLRNESYWKAAPDGGLFPYLDEIRFHPTPEGVVQAAALETGDADLLSEPDEAQFDILDSNPDFQTSVQVGRSLGVVYFPHNIAPLDNLNYRRALAWGFDWQGWSDVFSGGREQKADCYLTPISWAYRPIPEFPDYDPQKARDFLEASGIPEAERIFNLNVSASADSRLQGEFVQQVWADIGVQVILHTGAAGEGKSLRAYGGTGEHGINSGLSMRADPDGFLSLLFTEEGTYNWGFGKTGDAETLLNRASQIYDQEERSELYYEAMRIAADQVYSVIPKTFTNNTAYASRRVGGLDSLWGGETKQRYSTLWLES